MPRMFRLFRGLGLRHLIIVDGQNKVNYNVNSPLRKDLEDNFKWFSFVKSLHNSKSKGSFGFLPQVVGMVTRKDLAKYRQTQTRTNVGVRQLQIHQDWTVFYNLKLHITRNE